MVVRLSDPPLTEAQRELAAAHVGLALTVARRAARRIWFIRDDLESEAQLALCRAARDFRPGSGVPFRPYAWRRTNGACLDLIKSTIKRLQHETVSTPTLGIELDCCAAEHETFRAVEGRVDWLAIADRALLTDRDREIALAVAGGERTIDVGRRVGISQSRASAVHARAIEAMRAAIGTP